MPQPRSVVDNHDGLWIRRLRFESARGYLRTCGLVVRTPASHAGDPRFKERGFTPFQTPYRVGNSGQVHSFMIMEKSFYERDTLEVAKALLGKKLVRETSKGTMAGIINEVEAYKQDDPASHSCNGLTPRSRVMFGEPGHAYVYLCYGMYWMLNFVTEPKGTAGAVLVRGVKPLEGIELMKKNRRIQDLNNLSNGPGKICEALKINKNHNGLDVTKGKLRVEKGIEPKKIGKSTRIGISKGIDKQWRFFFNP